MELSRDLRLEQNHENIVVHVIRWLILWAVSSLTLQDDPPFYCDVSLIASEYIAILIHVLPSNVIYRRHRSSGLHGCPIALLSPPSNNSIVWFISIPLAIANCSKILDLMT